MGLLQAHKGYEYQDLLSGLFIIENLLNDIDAKVKIDKKESDNDKFDDFTLISTDKIMKRQIKYSDDKVLSKADFSSSSYDLALDILFKSWKETSRLVKTELRICLAWEYIENQNEIDFLSTIECENIYNDDNVKFLKFDIEQIWEKGNPPKSTWRRLRSQCQHQSIDRDEFALFLNEVIIEVNLPKASNDISNPDVLEKIVFSKLRRFGVGKYPNHHKTIEDVLLNLTHIIKNARSTGDEIRLNEIIYRLGLKSDYGNILQDFDINEDLNVINESRFHRFNDFVLMNNKTMILGEPGAGKSWFVQNYIKYIKAKNIKVIQHYCYTGLDDNYEKERITINIFLANLINDIITCFPELAIYKSTKYGVDIDELQALLNQVSEDTVLIIDGLDHIGRVYNFHKAIMKQIETEIIKVLSTLIFPEKVHVILASQPVSDVINLTEQGYEMYTMEPWDIGEVNDLLIKSNIEDCSLNRDISLSEMLLGKSNGNPLYLTYLINEIIRKKTSYMSVDFFEKFPLYNNNLSSYYEYLMSLIPESQKVPQVLAGAPFYLTKKELNEITHLGKYVDDSLDTIQSILIQNKCNGGYTIYHESFRRYILETLEKKEVNVQRLIYDDLIEWLKRNGFYNARKSYLHLFVLLFESERYEEIIKYCNKEFVVDSIFYGNNIHSIKGNFEILIKTACIEKNYGALVICTELSNMIYSIEYSFDENSELYYEALGLINGFSNLKNTLLYDGRMALDVTQGLKVCYLCSKNNCVPDWEPYINQLINKKRRTEYENNSVKEHYRYFICACIDLGWDMEERLSKIRYEQLEDYRQIVIEEYCRRNELDILELVINRILDNEHWSKSLAIYLGDIDGTDLSYTTQCFKSLKEVDSHSDDSMMAINFYVKNIRKIVEYHNEELEVFLETIKNRNWFYNWLIYFAEINRALHNMTNDEFEIHITNAYRWLTYDTEPFKGTPRTCDLFNYESVIYETIKAPMRYIKTKETWADVIGIVKIMSEETTTTLQGATGGPLPTYKFLNILMEVSNEENNEIILEVINGKITKEKKYRLYSYLADYSFKNAIILAKAGKTDLSKEAFKQGIIYMLSYSSRKDRTLSHLLDSVLSTYKLDNVVGLRNILKLKPLADAVVRHTDGKSTKTYQREWFELLSNSNIDLAMSYIRNELIQCVNHWIIEGSLESLLKASNGTLAPKIVNVLFKTFPNIITEDFISAYLKNIEILLEEKLEMDAERSFKELMSRFDSYDQVEFSNHNLINRMILLCKSFGIHWSGKIRLTKSKSLGGSVTPRKNISRKNFTDFSYKEMLDYIKEYGIRNEDSLGIYYFLNQNLNKMLDAEDRLFLSDLIYSCFERRSTDFSSNKLIEIVSNLRLNDEQMAFLYMQMFLHHTDGWYHRFTQTEFFKKAHDYDSNEAERVFFEYIYYNFYSVDYSLAVGGEIVNSLAAINYDNKLVFEYWDSLYDIINFRLSGQNDYDWDELRRQAEDFDTDEKLLSLLLSRLKYGEKNRFNWIISELDYLLDDKLTKSKFIKPFIQFLREKDEYIEYALTLILVLIKKHYTFKEIVESDLKNALEQIYPTNNSIINFLVRSIIRKKIDRIYCENNMGQVFYDEKTVYYINSISKIDNRISLLGNWGINIEDVVKAYIDEVEGESFVVEKRDILFNGTYQKLIPNVYFYDVLTRHFGIEGEKHLRTLAGTPFLEQAEDEIFDAVLEDIPLMIAQHTSIGPRPQDLALPEFIEEGYKEVEINDWVRIGYFEKWYSKIEKYKRNFVENSDAITILSGVGFGRENSLVPFIELDNEYRFLQENEYQHIIPINIFNISAFLTTNISLDDDDPYLTYNTKQLLGVRADVLQYLQIQMRNSGCGIVGISKDGEEVIRYSRWEVSHLDDSDNIPYLIGSQLLMKKRTFEELCSIMKEKPLLCTRRFE